MSIAKTLAVGAAAAVATYYLDPRSGRRRRALVKNQIDHAMRAAPASLVAARSDLEHRVHGTISEARRLVSETEDGTDDATIVARVRSQLGRVSGSVHSICTESREGIVEVSGQVPEQEADSVIRAVRFTRGVRDVVDNLDRRPLDQLQNIEARRLPPIARRRRGYWYPATRLAVGSSSLAAMLVGAVRGGPGGAALIALGGAGLLRSATNRSMKEVIGIGRPSRPIELQKTVSFDTPVEEVYALLSSFEKLPRFFRHLETVHRTPDDQWRFGFAGPAGTKVQLDGYVLEAVPNELLSWTTSEGALFELTGLARFERLGADKTRVTIRITYWPPAGLMGHQIASLFHVDPKHELDEDMIRLRSLLEQGKATGHDGQVAIEELRRS